MNALMYLKVFAVGGFICLLGQILVIRTKITPARILVIFLILGVVLETIGIYEPILKFAGAGVSVPIVGFGANLAKGAIDGGLAEGILGVFKGGLTASAAGLTAAIVFSYIVALIFNSKTKKH